jgi:hypothetical protein
VLLLMIRYAWLNRGDVLPRAGPILYPMLFLLIAYSLSAGNAGTGFRYRTHLVTLGVAAVAVLREHALRRRRDAQGAAALPEAGPSEPRAVVGSAI